MAQIAFLKKKKKISLSNEAAHFNSCYYCWYMNDTVDNQGADILGLKMEGELLREVGGY